MANSLSERLTYRIMAVVLVMMAIITGLVYFTVRKYMLNEAKERYLSILLQNQQELRRRLSDVHVAVQNNVHDIERDIDDPDKMFDHLERIVKKNPSIACTSLLFKKDYYSSKGSVFIPCARRDAADSVRVTEIDSTYHSYFYDEWFQEQLMKDDNTWTKAYFESEMFAGDQEPRLLTTYAVPIHDRQGHPVAILCADMSLEELRDHMMEDIKDMNDQHEKGQKHHSYFFIIDQEGSYIVHPDKERMMKLIDENVGRMMLTHRGTCVTEVDGIKSCLYYRTVKHVGWVMVIVTPEDVILSKARGLNIIILTLMFMGLAAIYLFCRRQIKKTTRPLQRFARSAEEVALGNFSSSLPDVNDYDEVQQLHDAFANMQSSLATYVDELQKTTTQNASLERELKIAHDIQMAMVPTSLNDQPSSLTAHLDLAASLTPARDVGGDLYDYFLRDNRLFFCIGDVSGKGMPAALMMAVMRAMFRGETRRANSAVSIIDTVNRNLSEEYTGGYFVTMFVGILDLTTGHLDYCNAGHEAPLVCTKGENGKPSSYYLPVKPNLPVGALTDWDYEGQETQLQSGDMLFLYTDGLSEANNNQREQLGRKRVLELAIEHSNDTAKQLVKSMEEAVKLHAGDADQSDDITLLAIKCPQLSTDNSDLSSPTSHLSMRASMEDIAKLEPFIARVSERAGAGEKEIKRLRLAVEEAVANVINHGEATNIDIQAGVQNEQLVFTIEDDGQPFDPTKASGTDLSVPADQRPPGGMGIILLHQMTDGLTYQRNDGHNILTMKKKIK